MASRKSPSQRDPLTRLSQAVRSVAPQSMGGRVANAAPVKTTATPTRRAAGAPTGQLLGWAELTVTFGSIAGGTLVNATGVTLDGWIGNPGVTVSGANLTVCSDGIGSIYSETARLIPVMGTGCTATDTHFFSFGDPVCGSCYGSLRGADGSGGYLAFPGLQHLSVAVTQTPIASAATTAGTGRSYSVTAALTIARFALPT